MRNLLYNSNCIRHKAILKYYLNGKRKDEYISPIIKREDPEWIRKDIKNGLKTFNKYLRKIAEELEIEGEMSS